MRFAVTLPDKPDPSTYGMPGYIQPVRKPKTDITPDLQQKRSDAFQFGSRYLEEGDNIFDYNAWDHVETDDAYKQFAEAQYAKQRENPVSEFDRKRFNDNPEKWWNKFYANNTANFFKNRKWLQQEFPILTEVTQESAPETVILEVGAGAGNTAFPIMEQNKNAKLRLHACDFSKKAVEVIQTNPIYTSEGTVGTLKASVWDVASPPSEDSGLPVLPEGIEAGSVDIVILIFIFSALSPSQWDLALRNVWRALKPGGVVLFRDYGRHDLAMVRFKNGRWLDDNFYVRGDGTRVYFFDENELKSIWTGKQADEADEADELANKLQSLQLREPSSPQFEIVKFGVDRRMLVNRQRRLKMYRCWMQGCFRKPASPSE